MVLEPEEFSDIMVDLRLAESNYKLISRTPSYPQNLLDSSYFLIYSIHKVTPQVVDSSFKFYVKHPDYMMQIDQMVLDKLNKLE